MCSWLHLVFLLQLWRAFYLCRIIYELLSGATIAMDDKTFYAAAATAAAAAITSNNDSTM